MQYEISWLWFAFLTLKFSCLFRFSNDAWTRLRLTSAQRANNERQLVECLATALPKHGLCRGYFLTIPWLFIRRKVNTRPITEGKKRCQKLHAQVNQRRGKGAFHSPALRKRQIFGVRKELGRKPKQFVRLRVHLDVPLCAQVYTNAH